MNYMRKLSKYGLLSAILLMGCAVNPVTGKKDFMLLSEQDEIRMGQESDPAVVASFGLYEDPSLATLLDTKGQQMAAISHRPHLKYEFKVLDSPVVNAFALPGGYVYFTRGILAHFNNEAEFAGVLGHEIGHITARHSAKQYSSQQLFQAGFIAGLIISPEFAQFSGLTQQAVGLLFLKFSRDHESQSDYLGVEYSTEIGYDAREMAHFFETIGRLSGGGGAIPDFLSTHPNPDDRFDNVRELAEQQQNVDSKESYMVNRDQYLDLINGLVYGDDPRKGFVEDNTFFHPNDKYKFSIPGEWETNIASNRLLAAHESGEALIVISPEQEVSTLQEAVNAARESLSLSIIEQNDAEINGIDAITVEAVQQNPQQPGTSYPFSIVFYSYNDRIYRALGVTTKGARNQFAEAILRSIRSMERLTDPVRLNVQPERLTITTVERGGTLSEVLKSFGISEERLEEFAVLNGRYLDETVNAGDRIKILLNPSTS